MDYNFTGSSTPIRQINLGGPSGPTAAQLAAKARAERAERESNRKRHSSAKKIQSSYRGTAAAAKSRAELAFQFQTRIEDATSAHGLGDDPGRAVRSLLELTRLLVFSCRFKGQGYKADEAERLMRWCDAVTSQQIDSGRPILFLPFSSTNPTQVSSWVILLSLACRQLMRQVSEYGGKLPAQASLSFFNFLNLITSTAGPHPASRVQVPNSQASLQPSLAEVAGDYLVTKGLHASLRSFIMSFPADRKASAAIGPAITLSLSVFKIFARGTVPGQVGGESLSNPIVVEDEDMDKLDVSARAKAISSFAAHILTIPQIPSRIPIPAITEMTASWPMLDILSHTLALASYISLSTGDDALRNNPLRSPFYLANLLAFGAKRVPHFKDGKVVRDYLEALSAVQDALPNEVFLSADEWSERLPGKRPKVLHIDPDLSSDGEDMELDVVPASSSSAPEPKKVEGADFPLPIDASTHKWLQTLVSETHISSLISLSSRFPNSTRLALCRFLCSTLIAWPSATRERVLNTVMYGFVQNSTLGGLQAAKGGAGSSVGGLVRELWRGHVRGNHLAKRLASAQIQSGAKEILVTLSDEAYGDEWPALVLLCELYSRCLLTIGDDEFYPTSTPLGASASNAPSRNPLSLDEVISLSTLLRNLAFAMYWHEGTGLLADIQASSPGTVGRVPGMKLSYLALRGLVTKLLQQLHARDSRRPFAPKDHWLMVSQLDLQSFIQTVILEEQELAEPAAHPDGDESNGVASGFGGPGSRTDEDDQFPAQSRVSSRLLAQRGKAGRLSAKNLAFLSPRLGVLNNIPFVIPFEVRVEIFRQFVAIDMKRNNVRRSHYRGLRNVKVRRGLVAEDGFMQLNGLGPKLKERIEIIFIDQFGQPEAGIDGGGVFKEFLTSLVKEAFDTDRGLWKATDNQELYPNPHSYAQSPEQLEWYSFLGRILGKALYEGILVDVKFAGFFLSKWLGKQSYLDDLASLDSLDKDLYRGLIYLKNYPGDVEADLGLTFAVTDEEFGVRKTTELVPNGANLAVTRENRLRYIYLVSHYRLSAQISKQCDAFFRGLSEMIDPRWLRMLNREELRVLVSGTEEPMDVEDLRENTEYGGYHPKDMAIEYFWETLRKFDNPTRRAFLKFVTSSPNPPLLGFSQLYPKFGIRNSGTDTDRLPTASTCVNLLKLPQYESQEQCEKKLRYAIESGAGFDLS
ncbi:HECT-domain-containing protein [Violaceomyces palustris]|uniref:HECT-domain-containing protein n=1 Tax=Violaceomyces palustris TaxID=1673888 RepID=A0ACD0P7V3_9BASI|nr:HECT-domain-containing protein [Violaceomyces palustris]